jgi:ferrous iron transport protein B
MVHNTHPPQSKRPLTIALGKSELRQNPCVYAMTGARQHVGNWPGVTVEKKEGKVNYRG